MKKLKKLLISFLIVPVLAMAGANDIQLTQRNSTDTGIINRLLPTPGDGFDRIFFFNGNSLLPGYLSLGANLSSSAGVLNAVGSDWNATSGQPGFIQNKPSLTSGTVTSVTAGAGLSGGTITTSGTISLPNTGTASTYSGVTTDAQGRVIAGTARSFSYQTRALNTCFQPSASRDVMAVYPVEISASLSLSGGTVGTVYLRTYTNSGCSTGTQEVMRAVNSNTGALTIGLNTTQTSTGALTGIIPAGLWVQLVTENTTGTPTFTARPGQEILL